MKTRKNLLKSLTLASFFISSLCLINSTASAKENLTVGAVATTDMIKVYYPPFKVGSKWIYNSKTSMSSMEISNFDLTTQIMKVSGDKVTVKATGAGINIERTVSKKDFSPLNSNEPALKSIVYKYVGKENVSVPEGSYSGADKFTTNGVNNMQTKVWFVKGKGAIKSQSQSSTNGMNILSIVSLKKFSH